MCIRDRLSGGQAVLVDAGTAQSAESLVSYLQELGVTELYAAISTHPHADHIGGCLLYTSRCV